MFPTDENGNPLAELSGEKIKVYKHIGNNEYVLVYENGKVVSPTAEGPVRPEAPSKNDGAIAFAAIDIASSIQERKKYGVLSGDGSVVDEEQTLDLVDADYGRIRALSERGKLTKSALMNTSWGRALASTNLDQVVNALNNNPNAVDEVFNRIKNQLESQAEPTTAASTTTGPVRPEAPSAPAQRMTASERANSVAQNMAKAVELQNRGVKKYQVAGMAAQNQIIASDERMREVMAKFDSAVAQLENNGKLKRRCP